MTEALKPMPNLEEMTDEQIENMDPALYEQESVAPTVEAVGVKSVDDDDDGVADGDAGGAAAVVGTSADVTVGTDSTSVGKQDGVVTPPAAAVSDGASGDDQSADKGTSDAAVKETDGAIDYKAEYEKLMAPFKAAKRMVALGNSEDARRLLQMGADYSNKMANLKPHLRVLRTLEKAELLDPSRINFLIDLDKKNPEAIKQLLKEAGIDPLTVDLGSGGTYSAPNRMIGDAELAVRDVLDNIQFSPKFAETVDVITKGLDLKSRQQLQESPEVIATLHEHIEAGLYHQVQDRVANERMLGRLKGLSDLEAYYQVGDAMHKAGQFTTTTAPATTGDTTKGTAQGSGSGTSATADATLRDQRRAASPTKGKAAVGGMVIPDFSKMTDAEIEKFDMSTLP